MATVNKRAITWCFMPSQPVRLDQGEERVREVLYIKIKIKKRAVIQTNAGECLVRQRSAARRELKTEASWGEFLELNIGERAGKQKLDMKGVKGVEQLSLNNAGTRSRLRGGIKKREERKHSNR